MYCWPRAAYCPTAASLRLLERGGEKAVGAVASLVGCEIVDFFEIDAVDLRERNEFEDVDRAGRFFVEGLELFLREHDVLPLGELVSLDRIVTRDDFAVLRADVLLLEPGFARLVQHVERNRDGRTPRTNTDSRVRKRVRTRWSRWQSSAQAYEDRRPEGTEGPRTDCLLKI